MRGLDSNVLLRYLLRDHPEQSERARNALRAAAETGERLFLAAIVLCEVVWVLERSYGLRRPDVAALLERLLEGREFEFEYHELVIRALQQYRSGKGDFADYLIGAVNRQHGCSKTMTFDRALDGAAEFEVL